MSLNVKERHITSEELKAHFEHAQITLTELSDILEVPTQQIQCILDMDTKKSDLSLNAFIHLVWDVRDVLNMKIAMLGDIPKEYTYLKGEKSDYWFLT